jgi:hypothetical protein
MTQMLKLLQTGPEGRASGLEQSDSTEEASKLHLITSSTTLEEAQSGTTTLGRNRWL